MKKFILSLSMLAAAGGYAQTGINNTAPKATLDITAKNTDGSTPEGVKTPQLTGDAVKAMTANLTADQNGMLVYVTTPVTTPDAATNNVTIPGYYRFNFEITGSVKSWRRLEPSGLEKITENNKSGWRLIGDNPNNYGDIGLSAIDFTYSENPSNQIGALGNVSFTAGYEATATQEGGVALGSLAKSTGFASNAIGYFSAASGYASSAIGTHSTATGYASLSFGSEAKSSGNYATAIGADAQADGEYTLALASGVTSANYSVSVGKNSSTSAINSLAMMGGTTAAGADNSVALGEGTKAIGRYSIAMGTDATASGYYSYVLGYGATATQENSFSIGYGSKSSNMHSYSFGTWAMAGGYMSMALGTSSNANATSSLAMMGGTTAAGADNSVAIGNGTTATTAKPFALGTNGNQLTITSNEDIMIEKVGKGIIMKSPNGSCFRVTVTDAGALSPAAITCP